jgi:hypothetical protein
MWRIRLIFGIIWHVLYYTSREQLCELEHACIAQYDWEINKKIIQLNRINVFATAVEVVLKLYNTKSFGNITLMYI